MYDYDYTEGPSPDVLINIEAVHSKSLVHINKQSFKQMIEEAVKAGTDSNDGKAVTVVVNIRACHNKARIIIA